MTFEGIRGSSYTGDLAIDDVSISSGSCFGQTTAPPTFPSASTYVPSSGLPTSGLPSSTHNPSNLPTSSPGIAYYLLIILSSKQAVSCMRGEFSANECFLIVFES